MAFQILAVVAPITIAIIAYLNLRNTREGNNGPKPLIRPLAPAEVRIGNNGALLLGIRIINRRKYPIELNDGYVEFSGFSPVRMPSSLIDRVALSHLQGGKLVVHSAGNLAPGDHTDFTIGVGVSIDSLSNPRKKFKVRVFYFDRNQGKKLAMKRRYRFPRTHRSAFMSEPIGASAVTSSSKSDQERLP